MRLLRVCGLLFGAAVAVTVAGIGAARATYHDPFARYQAIMPGQPIEAVEDFPCHLYVGMMSGTEAGFCQFEASDGIFARVTVIDSNHTVTRISFTVQPDRLRLGDLILCSGNPTEVAAYGIDDPPKLMHLLWGSEMDASISHAGSPFQLDFFLPVLYLSIEHEGPPCRSTE